MAIADKIRDEKLQYKIICFTLGKALEKQPKTIWDQERKKAEALKMLKPDFRKLTIKDVILRDQLNKEAKSEIEKIKGIEKKCWIEKIQFLKQANVYAITNNLKLFY